MGTNALLIGEWEPSIIKGTNFLKEGLSFLILKFVVFGFWEINGNQELGNKPSYQAFNWKK